MDCYRHFKFSKTEDLYRLYFQITCNIDKFYIYGYFGIQFHVLHYYKLDKEVIKIQKELIKLNQDVSESFISLADKGNKIIGEELRRQGINNLSFEELFAKIYENSNLMNNLEQKAFKTRTTTLKLIIKIKEKQLNSNAK